MGKITAVVAASVVTAGLVATSAQAAPSTTSHVLQGATPSGPPGPLVARYAVVKGAQGAGSVGTAAAAAATTIPTWTSSIVVGGTNYTYSMVGNNPMVHRTNPSTSVPTELIPVKFTFTVDGTVFDPAAADPTCSPAGTPLALTQASPIFKNHSLIAGTTNVGTGQYTDEFQRAEFYSFTKPTGTNPNYNVKLALKTLPEVSLSVSGGSTQATPCGRIGFLSIGSWDAYVQGTLIPSLASSGVSPKTFPIFLFYNVVLVNGSQCCILGYHGTYYPGGHMQTYGTAEYDSTKGFSGVGDVQSLSHEVAEWINDPTGVNPVPAWGHIGQQPGCQTNLEVGDPLSGTRIAMTMPNHVTYHVQEMAFYSWFYQQGSSIGVNGWYSSNGTFKTPSTTCH